MVSVLSSVSTLLALRCIWSVSEPATSPFRLLPRSSPASS